MNLLLRQLLRTPDHPAFSQYHLLLKASGQECSLPASKHSELLLGPAAGAVFMKPRPSYRLPPSWLRGLAQPGSHSRKPVIA